MSTAHYPVFLESSLIRMLFLASQEEICLNLKLILSGMSTFCADAYFHVNHWHRITKLSHLVLPAGKVSDASVDHGVHSLSCQKLINVDIFHCAVGEAYADPYLITIIL